ncbi:MAG: RNA polymerase sigma factor [Deferribacteres bacterium]|nr:RNA polymerase sigma factor [candidate division KSB1 bacterium]MCB9503846.1 RNA polymerase sigma factor [Deferribacteres bacterium]
MHLDEQQIIQKIRDGDATAFREVVEKHKRDIYYLALDFTGNHHDAEDLAQDVFVQVFRSIQSFRGESSLRVWLHRITVNLFINKRRKKALSAMELKEDFSHEYSENTSFDGGRIHGNPEQTTESGFALTHINSALQSLSERERSVFVLRHYKDMQLKDIAATLHIAEGTVKGLLFRAIRKLQKELAFYRQDLGLEASE